MSPSPTSRSTESEEAALLALAINAYQPFNAGLDRYLAGEAPEIALEGLVTTAFLEQLQRESGENPRTTVSRGSSSFAEEKLVDTAGTPLEDDVALVVCRDVSRTTIVDAETGADAATPDRRLKIPTLVSLSRDSENQQGLLVMGVDAWEEDGYCQ